MAAPKLSKEQMVEIPKFYKQGLNVLEIAEMLKISHPAVLYHLKKFGIKTKSQGHHHIKLSTEDVAAIVAAYSAGEGSSSIALRYGVKSGSILRHLRIAKVSTHNKTGIHYKPASSAARYAIKIGKLVRPACCESCHKEKTVIAHHDDYNKSLAVRWLCHACHRHWHKHNQAIPYCP